MKKIITCLILVLCTAAALLLQNHHTTTANTAEEPPAASAVQPSVSAEPEEDTVSMDYIDYGDGMMIAMDYVCDVDKKTDPCSEPEWRYEFHDNGMLKYFANEDRTQSMTFYEDGTRKTYFVMHIHGSDSVAFNEDGRVAEYQREGENWKTKAEGDMVFYGTADLVDQASKDQNIDTSDGILIAETYSGYELRHVRVNDHGAVSEYDISYDETVVCPGTEEFGRSFYYPVNAVMPEKNEEGKLKKIINPFLRTAITFHYMGEQKP